MECRGCGAHWPVEQGIASYGSASYYGELTQETMHELNALAREGHWLAAARAMFQGRNPELYDYVADLNRASWIPILPLGPDSTVLDVSCGLGALTHALALTYRYVVAVEPVGEMVRFAKLRCEQEDLKNVDVVQSKLDVLPFPKDTFDLIVLNGVLEWMRESRSSRTPRQAQLDFLRDLRRLLKPHGVLVIGSENRLGYTAFLPQNDRLRRWLDSLYGRLKKPGFYRALVDPTKGHGTGSHSHSPSGYRRLLRQSGFPAVDLWWPPNGYNSPHMMLRAANRAAIRAHWDFERRYKDRLHGYGLGRQLRHVAVVNTRLIHITLPDVIMIASRTEPGGESHRSLSILAAVAEYLSGESGLSPQNVAGGQEYLVESVVTHPYKNKVVVRIASGTTATAAVVKIANVRLPGVEVLQRSYEKLQRLCSSTKSNARVLAGSTPSPLGIVRAGSLLATIETAARGRRVVDLILDRRYFARRDRVRRHLEHITSWLIASRPALNALESERPFDAIPAEWLLEPDGQDVGRQGSLPDRFTGIQHGDFYPENIFLDEEAQEICVVDWDSCATGYPPLFDWFCFITGLYYTHDRVAGLPKGQTVEVMSFRQTYFETSWFSELILRFSYRLCDSLGLDTGKLFEYFRLYITVRYRQFASQSELEEKHYWGPRNRDLYRQFLVLLLKNKKQCCFWKGGVRVVP
jgi:SAM-dependent methyltransferase